MKLVKCLLMTFGVMSLLTACSGGEDPLSGEWVGGESRLFLDGSTADCQMTSRLKFTPDANDNSKGTVEIASDIMVRDDVTVWDSAGIDMSTYDVVIAGHSSISGTYVKDGDDDVIVAFEYSSIKASVKPEGVSLGTEYSGASDTDSDVIDRKGLAARYQSLIHRAVRDEYRRYVKIEDIEFKHNIMTCEIEKLHVGGLEVDGDECIFRRLNIDKEK